MSYTFYTVVAIKHVSDLYDQEGDWFARIIKSFIDKEDAEEWIKKEGYPHQWSIHRQTLSDSIILHLCQERENRKV